MSAIPDIADIHRSIESIIQSTAQAADDTVALSNGEQVVWTITTTNTRAPLTAKVLTQVDHSLYAGSYAVANQLPGGSGIDESQWQIIGPWKDWGATNNINDKWKIYVRNISAGASVSLFLRAKVRVISNTLTIGGSST